MLLMACGPEISGENITENQSVTGGTVTENSEARVDISDFSDETSKFYGGELEDDLSDALDTTAVISDDNYDYYLSDGAIEVRDAQVGDGYTVVMNREMDNFSIYGVYVGMSSDEAVKILEDQGLKEESDDYTTIYAKDKYDFYVTFDAEDGTVTQVNYSKVIPSAC